jgi:hypothetical protein
MKKKYVYERVSQKARYDLPAPLNREIGRLIVRWAHFENHLQSMITAILFDGAKDGAALGRLAVRELKVGERADLLARVADLRGVVLDKALLKAIKVKAIAISDQRNLLAHGIWTSTPDIGWIVRQTRGAWDEHPEGPRGKRSIEVQAIVANLEKLIADAKILQQTLRTPV